MVAHFGKYAYTGEGLMSRFTCWWAHMVSQQLVKLSPTIIDRIWVHGHNVCLFILGLGRTFFDVSIIHVSLTE